MDAERVNRQREDRAVSQGHCATQDQTERLRRSLWWLAGTAPGSFREASSPVAV